MQAKSKRLTAENEPVIEWILLCQAEILKAL